MYELNYTSTNQVRHTPESDFGVPREEAIEGKTVKIYARTKLQSGFLDPLKIEPSNLFDDAVRRQISLCYTNIYEWLGQPVIMDDFEQLTGKNQQDTHPERIAWKREVQKKHPEFFKEYLEKNKMRSSQSAIPFMEVDMLLSYVPENSDLSIVLNKLQSKYTDLMKRLRGHQMSLELIKQVENMAVQVLDIIAESSKYRSTNASVLPIPIS